MTDAADKLQENKDEQGISDVIVPCDGSWQTLCHSSLNGVCGDCNIKRFIRWMPWLLCHDKKACKACESWESRKGSTEEHELFLPYHECEINHGGSLGSMEAAGIVECFLWI